MLLDERWDSRLKSVSYPNVYTKVCMLKGADSKHKTGIPLGFSILKNAISTLWSTVKIDPSN